MGYPQLKLVHIEPGSTERVANKRDGRLNPQFTEQLSQVFRKAGQDVDQMTQAHEVMIAFHGVPVFSERMLVGVTLVLLDQKRPFDPPTITGTEVTARMDVESTDRAAGDPGVFVRFGDDLRGLGIDLLPLLVTDHHVDVELVFVIGAYLLIRRKLKESIKRQNKE